MKNVVKNYLTLATAPDYLLMFVLFDTYQSNGNTHCTDEKKFEQCPIKSIVRAVDNS